MKLNLVGAIPIHICKLNEIENFLEMACPTEFTPSQADFPKGPKHTYLLSEMGRSSRYALTIPTSTRGSYGFQVTKQNLLPIAVSLENHPGPNNTRVLNLKCIVDHYNIIHHDQYIKVKHVILIF
jgi:hypothetical protein